MNKSALLLGWIATAAVTSGALGIDVGSKGDDNEGLGGIAEDIEIMQRLLGKALSSHYGGKAGLARNTALGMAYQAGQSLDRANLKITNDPVSDERVAALYAIGAYQNAGLAMRSGRFDVTGYYVAGVGAMFTFKLPVSFREAEASPEGEEAEDDPWTQTEGEVRGTRHAGLRISGARLRKNMVLDESALNESIDVLLEAVGKFGLRIEGLSASDSIVLAARLEGAGVTTWTNALVLNMARGNLAAALSPGAFRVTVRIPVSAIREFADDDGDLQSLRERSEITRYRVAAGTTSGGWRTR